MKHPCVSVRLLGWSMVEWLPCSCPKSRCSLQEEQEQRITFPTCVPKPEKETHVLGPRDPTLLNTPSPSEWAIGMDFPFSVSNSYICFTFWFIYDKQSFGKDAFLSRAMMPGSREGNKGENFDAPWDGKAIILGWWWWKNSSLQSASFAWTLREKGWTTRKRPCQGKHGQHAWTLEGCFCDMNEKSCMGHWHQSPYRLHTETSPDSHTCLQAWPILSPISFPAEKSKWIHFMLQGIRNPKSLCGVLGQVGIWDFAVSFSLAFQVLAPFWPVSNVYSY